MLQWKKLKMTFLEKLLMILSIAFHAMVIPTFVCSLVLMAEKEDTDQRLLLASAKTVIWAAKIIIGIGLFIEIYFVVYQCNLFVQLFHKWRNYNRIIYIQNAPNVGGTVQQQKQQAVSDIILPWNIASLARQYLSDHSTKSYVFINKCIFVLKLRHRFITHNIS